MKQCIVCFIILFTSTLYSQSTLKSFNQLSAPEKKWVLTHPFIAKKAHSISLKAREAAKQLLNDTILDKDENGGQVDAFRHAYWMALLSQKINSKKAFKLGLAHEKGNYISFKKGLFEEGAQPDSLSSVMDIYNNVVGIEIGKENKKLNEQELKDYVIKAVKAGDMRVLKKDRNRNYIDCNGNVIDLTQFKGKWQIPKCLLSSEKRI